MRHSPSAAQHVLTLAPDLAETARVRRLLEELAPSLGFPPDRIFDMEVAVSEAVANALEHAHGSGEVKMDVLVYPDRLQVRVWGPGEFHVPVAEDGREHRGLGLPLMATLSDHLALYSRADGGSLVALTFYAPGAGPHASDVPPGLMQFPSGHPRVDEVIDSGLGLPAEDQGKEMTAQQEGQELALADIIDVPAIQSLMDDFYQLAGIPMSIVDMEGNVLVGVGWQDICGKFHRAHPETCRFCTESDLELSAGVAQGDFKLYKCKNSMWDIVTPLVVGGRHIGNVFSGQFFFEDELVDKELFRAQAGRYGFDEKDYLSALDAVPRLTRDSVQTGLSFLVRLADLVSGLSYSNIKLAQADRERERLLRQVQDASEAMAVLNEELLAQNRELGQQQEELRVRAEEASQARSLEEERARLAAAVNDIDEILLSARPLEQILELVIGKAAQVAGAGIGVIELREGDGWKVAHRYGSTSRWSKSLTAELPAVAAIPSPLAGPLLIEDASGESGSDSSALGKRGLLSLLGVPFGDQDRVAGFLFLGNLTPSPERKPARVDFAKKLGTGLSLAFENSLLLAERQEERALGEALVEITTVVTSELEVEFILRTLLREGMEALAADSAQCFRRNQEGEPWVASFIAGSLARGMQKLGLPDPRLALEAVRRKLPVSAPNPATPGSRFKAAVVVPLLRGAEVVCLLEFDYHEQREFTQPEESFCRRLLLIGSLALANARLLQGEREISLSLQHALLSSPPKVAGVEVGHLYRGATVSLEVGGDFYDIFELSKRRLGIVLGDVSGKGVIAAATASLVKNTIRAYLNEDEGVGRALNKANQLIMSAAPAHSFATVFAGILDLDTGRLCFVSAGHPPGLVRTVGGEVRSLEKPSPVVGVFERATYKEGVAHLDEGDLLLLYTDGIIETRRGPTFFGEEGVIEFLSRPALLSPADMPNQLLQEVLAFGGGRLLDDIAVLTLRRKGGRTRRARGLGGQAGAQPQSPSPTLFD